MECLAIIPRLLLASNSKIRPTSRAFSKSQTLLTLAAKETPQVATKRYKKSSNKSRAFSPEFSEDAAPAPSCKELLLPLLSHK